MAESENGEYQLLRGILLPGPAWCPRERLEEIFAYIPRDNDIILSAYPKTGSTWMQYIVLQIIHRGDWFPSFNDVINRDFPYIELSGLQAIEGLKLPRTYKHHCPYNLMQKNPNAKKIYTYRRPEDTFVSYFYFMQSTRQVTMDFNQYFEDFLSGNVGYGRYFEHVLSYFAHKNDPNLLLVSYEKLSSNTKEEILNIARFLGDEYYQDLVKDDGAILKKVLEHTSFGYMKKNLYLEYPSNPKTPGGPPEEEKTHKIDFFRKGVVGDGKRSLTSDQLERLRKVVLDVVQDEQLLNEWD